MAERDLDFNTRIQANDHLIKAVVALLTIRDPGFLKQLDDVFALSRAYGDEISSMNAEAWAHIRDEMQVVRAFALGDEDHSSLRHPLEVIGQEVETTA